MKVSPQAERLLIGGRSLFGPTLPESPQKSTTDKQPPNMNTSFPIVERHICKARGSHCLGCSRRRSNYLGSRARGYLENLNR